MALSQSDLKAALKAVFDAMPASHNAAAADLAAAYHDYAGGGLFGTSVPTLDDARRDAMAATLLAARATPASGLPATFAGAWTSALATYWTGAPVTGAQTGSTVGCPGAALQLAALTALFANLANTAETCATGLAAALHTATGTVTASVAPPPGTVLTIA